MTNKPSGPMLTEGFVPKMLLWIERGNAPRHYPKFGDVEPCCATAHQNEAGGWCCPHYGNTCGYHDEHGGAA